MNLIKNNFFTFIPFLFIFLQNHTAQFKISPNILYALAVTESNVNPYAINFNTYNKKEAYFTYKQIKNKIPLINIKIYKKYICVYPKNFLEAKKLFNMLKYLHYKSIDLGLMQINSKVLEKKHISLKKAYFNVYLNIKIASKILYRCYLRYKDEYKGNIKTIECYNKGFENEKFNGSYFNRFYSNFVSVIRKRNYIASTRDE